VQPLGVLAHDGDPGGDMEPVEQMLGLRIEVERQVAYVVPAVGEEGNLLVHLHPLGAQYLEEPPLRLGVVALL